MVKKVLVTSSADIEGGGLQNFLLNWIRMAPSDEFQFIWYCVGKVVDEDYKKLLDMYGVQLVIGNHKEEMIIKRCASLYHDMCKLMQEERFDIAHMSLGGLIPTSVGIKAAVDKNVPIKISHSHSTGPQRKSPWIKDIIYRIICPFFQSFLRSKVTWCVACSTEAGISWYGKQIIQHPKWRFIQNTIETRKFQFDKAIREEFRSKLSITTQIVLGCIGTVNDNKNHIFALQILKELKKRHLMAVKLVLIGHGPLEEKLKREAYRLEVAEDVYFLGYSNSVEKWLQAMDIYLMPSKFEGLPISALEAQAAGLPCVLSDRISRETQVSDLVSFVSIDDLDAWCRTMIDLVGKNGDRTKTSKLACESGIDNENIPRYMEALYK